MYHALVSGSLQSQMRRNVQFWPQTMSMFYENKAWYAAVFGTTQGDYVEHVEAKGTGKITCGDKGFILRHQNDVTVSDKMLRGKNYKNCKRDCVPTELWSNTAHRLIWGEMKGEYGTHWWQIHHFVIFIKSFTTLVKAANVKDWC